MKPKLARILTMAIAVAALALATDVSWSKGGGGHGGGGHGGGGHGGGHGGGGHAHFGGGHGGRHFGGGHFGGRHFAGGHHGGAHVSESRPPLANLYGSLNDEQRQRLEAVGTEENRHGRATVTAGTSGSDTLASLCGSQANSFTQLPEQRIEEIVKPTGPQRTALDQLKQASAKAADELHGSCPTQVGDTPTARLDAMSNRLDAMVHAVKGLRPTLGAFYASLSDEQKAQFNAMGQQSATENATGGQQQ
jgi:LTXXQ motif family protein